MTDHPDLAALTEQMLSAAAEAGATSADALAASATAIEIDVREGALEQATRSEGTEIGLRVFVGQRSAIVSSSELRREVIEAMAERAVAMAREAPEDPHAGLADPSQLATSWDLEALDLRDPEGEPSPDHLREMALEAEAAAMAVGGVTRSEGAGAGFSDRIMHLAASNGFRGGYGRTQSYLTASAITGEGTAMERDHDSDSRSHAADLRDPHEIGRSAGARAVARAAPRKPATGACPVLFDERVAASLIGHLLSAANGAMVARGSSWLLGREEAQILPEGLSLVEDPRRPRASGSRPFDGEGLPTAPREIVSDGRLTGWTMDLAAARKLGGQPTGSASRGVSSAPSPSVGNLTLTPGTASRAELIAQMGTGLIVTSLIGSTINPNTGDYSRGASGFWIEGGEIAHPVSEVTIAGNLLHMLPNLIPANDARPWVSRRVPSLLVPEGMTLAGA